MQRVKFRKGKQREFLKSAMQELNSPSLRTLLQFGLNIPYATLKNYFTERRLMPESFFQDLIHLSKINPESLNIKYLKYNWGQIKGGKISKRG